jgi:calmodulin
MDNVHVPDYLIAHFKEAFRIYDKNKDGYLDLSEFESAAKSLGKTVSEEEFANLSNRINFKVFSNLMYKKTSDPDIEEEVISAFRVFDKNNKGLITVSDLKNIMTTLGDKLSEDEINTMIREADIDNNGNINYEEFVRSMMTR